MQKSIEHIKQKTGPCIDKNALQEIESILKSTLELYLNEFSNFISSSGSFAESFFKDFPCDTGKINYSLQDIRGCCFYIGKQQIKSPAVSAPLAGISDNTFRIFAKSFGSAANYTEMISSYGIHFNNRQAHSLSYITKFERPCGIQIFGSEPQIMLEAALALEKNADFIDINMGCPVPKVLKSGSGGQLLKDEKKIADIVLKMSSKIKKPVTVKIRSGWDKNSINAVRISKVVESSGAAAVTVHGRTVKQGFSGDVDYEIIKKVKESVKIPVIASGDINNGIKAVNVLRGTGCDAVMMGRPAKGSPWVFHNVVYSLLAWYLLKNREPDIKQGKIQAFLNTLAGFEPSIIFKKNFAVAYLKLLIIFKGEKRAVKEFRKHLAWIFKGVREVKKVKNSFYSIESADDAITVIESTTLQ